MRAWVEERVAVAAPVEVAWAALTDWQGQSGWMILTAVTAEPGGHRVGERLDAFTGIGGVGFHDRMEVTRWAPPRRVEVAHLGRVVRGTGAFEVRPAPGGAAGTVLPGRWKRVLGRSEGCLPGSIICHPRAAPTEAPMPNLLRAWR